MASAAGFVREARERLGALRAFARAAGRWQEIEGTESPQEVARYIEEYQGLPGTAELVLRARSRLGALRQHAARSVEMEFVWVPAGSFQMGSRKRRKFSSDERPVTQVRISRGFYLGKHEVTQGQWEAVMGSNPSEFKNCGRDCPVENVSWEEVQEFVRKLNEMEGGERYRLPSEAEWEYAARAGSGTETYAGDLTKPEGHDPALDGIAWFDENSEGRTHPVGQKAANGLGLHDMLGNVWEWVADWHGDYPGGAVTDPKGPSTGSSRVFRGGSWLDDAGYCRASYRYDFTPGVRSFNLGFRLLRTN